MILEDYEREKFIKYLRRYIDDNIKILKQMIKIDVPVVLMEKIERETDAMETVVDMLESIEGTKL